ncbi:hypothetical protein ACFSKR_00130 [Kitasatospora cinereorecta]
MSLHFAAVNAEGIVADLDLLPAAYRALLKLRAHSEPGGRIEIDQSPSPACSTSAEQP